MYHIINHSLGIFPGLGAEKENQHCAIMKNKPNSTEVLTNRSAFSPFHNTRTETPPPFFACNIQIRQDTPDLGTVSFSHVSSELN